MTVLAHIALVFGVVFALLGIIGTLRFPDVYTRLQAASKCSTTAVLILYLGAMGLTGMSRITVRILIILLFALGTSPLSSHLIGRSAYECGLLPWRGHRKDASETEVGE